MVVPKVHEELPKLPLLKILWSGNSPSVRHVDVEHTPVDELASTHRLGSPPL